MSDRTKIEHMPGTNGRVHVDETANSYEAAYGDAETQPRPGISRLLVPAALVVTALIVLRRMQRGNYA